jgi:hypothetical protein
MNGILLALVLSAHPGDPNWIELKPTTTQYGKGNIRADVLNHAFNRTRIIKYPDRPTDTHENLHGIHAFLRNNALEQHKRVGNGFYVGDNRYIFLDQPRTRLSRVARMVPQRLQFDRYGTYLYKQRQYFENEPLYVMDEGVAYLLGAWTYIEDNGPGKGQWPCDMAVSQLEFTIYATALGQTVKADDPEYFEKTPQFKDFLAWYMTECCKAYHKAQANETTYYSGGTKYYNAIKDSPEAEGMRTFWEKDLGLDLAKLLP